MAWTNKGKARILNVAFRATSVPTNYYLALVDSSVAPTVDTNTLSQLGEIPNGNGYTTGGIQLTKNSTDFPTLNEDDSGDLAEIIIKDLTWTASGGTLPASGTGARYAVLTDDNGTVGSREVLAYWSLGSNVIVSSGQPLNVNALTLRLLEPS